MIVLKEKELENAFDEYVLGICDKAGVTTLDILIANIKNRDFNRERVKESLLNIIRYKDTTQPDAWIAIRRVIEDLKLSNKSSDNNYDNFSILIKVKIANDLRNGLESFDAYEAAMAFYKSGGILTPEFIDKLETVKEERTPLWMDLAIIVYGNDPDKLINIILSLITPDYNMGWKALKWRREELVKVFGQENFDKNIEIIANEIPDGDKLIEWLNKNRN